MAMSPRSLPTQTGCRRLHAHDIPNGHPVRRFQEYFLAKRRADGCLHREDFDTLDVVQIMPLMQILELVEPETYRYRLFGTAMADLIGCDLTGQHLQDIVDPRVLHLRLAEISDARTCNTPVYSTSELGFPEREFITVIRGMFPGCMAGRDLIFFPTAPADTQLTSPSTPVLPAGR